MVTRLHEIVTTEMYTVDGEYSTDEQTVFYVSSSVLQKCVLNMISPRNTEDRW